MAAGSLHILSTGAIPRAAAALPPWFTLLQGHVCGTCVCVQIVQMRLCVFSILSLLQGHFESVWVLRSKPPRISFSPQQRGGTEGLMDRWTDGSLALDEGRHGNGGIRHKLKGTARSHMQNTERKKKAQRGQAEQKIVSLGGVVHPGPSGLALISCPHKQ